ncbi:hypothetical protein DI09_83p30 [Mitosporidium daphniae]|uniref:6-phosphofructo-2-kinase domain-containing protein n=1 Tax=Mitosporidium daphniae TaxID=1485682 RepID=A0A098VMH5_9MICR|nr:uncharacterized protein DI09_83p30 [Mitosporidium daphniae]KGG50170.1 hypothetical protein DI09_83p30 [Mitosporidium daphniae]|eukprot:XP_013236611.1 uncharacterized protein DI09_83p30 [Mitosporidium daphniae]
MAAGCIKELSQWLTTEKGQVAIYDATNITVEIRRFILDQLPANIAPIFLEFTITHPATVEHNIDETARFCSEYSYLGFEKARFLLKTKLALLEPYYQSVGYSDSEKLFSCIHMIDVKSQIIIKNLYGYLEVSFHLMLVFSL